MSEDERRNIRRLLWRWGRVTEYCARRQHDIEEYNSLMENVADIKPQQLTGMPHAGTISDTTQRAAMQLSGLKERYEERVSELVDEIRKELALASAIDGAMQTLNAKEQAVIDLRYKKTRQYEQIAKSTGYAEDHVKKVEREAVDKLGELIKIETE